MMPRIAAYVVMVTAESISPLSTAHLNAVRRLASSASNHAYASRCLGLSQGHDLCLTQGEVACMSRPSLIGGHWLRAGPRELADGLQHGVKRVCPEDRSTASSDLRTSTPR